MARRRGFLAEMQHQARLAEQRNNAVVRQHNAAIRQAQAAQRSAERAHAAALRASEADRKRLEREAAVAHAEAMQAEVSSLNAQLADQFEEIDGLLSATLLVDDFVDLETLRVPVKNPPFTREDLSWPYDRPAPIPDPPLPVKQEVVEPTGMFGKKKKTAEAQAAVEAQYAADYYAWQAASADVAARRAAQDAQYEAAEERRKEELALAKVAYREQCDVAKREATEQNEQLDELIAGLGYGTVEAVQEYVGIVLANSVYPDGFDISHDATFEPSTAELTLRVVIPGPSTIPTTKTYRYVKASDEITTTELSQKEQKDRYAAIVNNVALRSVHEVFEADRRGLIQAISLELGTETISPATGRPTYVPFVALAVAREPFMELDLAEVTPSATLDHLRAAISKNPFGLVPVTTGGVRRA